MKRIFLGSLKNDDNFRRYVLRAYGVKECQNDTCWDDTITLGFATHRITVYQQEFLRFYRKINQEIGSTVWTTLPVGAGYQSNNAILVHKQLFFYFKLTGYYWDIINKWTENYEGVKLGQVKPLADYFICQTSGKIIQ